MQPLQALEHPKFHEMIAVAARAPKDEGVNIPGRKATRSHIVKLFDTHMKDLRERLSVCISFSLRILCSISSAYRVTARAILASLVMPGRRAIVTPILRSRAIGTRRVQTVSGAVKTTFWGLFS